MAFRPEECATIGHVTLGSHLPEWDRTSLPVGREDWITPLIWKPGVSGTPVPPSHPLSLSYRRKAPGSAGRPRVQTPQSASRSPQRGVLLSRSMLRLGARLSPGSPEALWLPEPFAFYALHPCDGCDSAVP